MASVVGRPKHRGILSGRPFRVGSFEGNPCNPTDVYCLELMMGEGYDSMHGNAIVFDDYPRVHRREQGGSAKGYRREDVSFSF